jgi:hypothetical protein
MQYVAKGTKKQSALFSNDVLDLKIKSKIPSYSS